MSTRILVTGAAGFAGSHLLDALDDEPGADIVAWRRPGEALPPGRAADGWVELDLRDREAVSRAVEAARPQVIYHLAGAAHVGEAWSSAAETLAVNALGTHVLLDACRRCGFTPRVLIPSSAYVYAPADRALTEDDPVRPNSPYGLSKLAQERVGLAAFEQDGIPVVIARAFNHVGPRQAPSFATSSFARQIATIEAGRAAPVMHVGNLSARRDLTDVRDTVRAYRLIVEHGEAGAVYNVCSGVARPVSEVLDGLLAAARVPVDVRVDPARLRPNDMPLVLGDLTRLRRHTGWEPRVPFEQTLADLLEYWRGVVAHSPTA